MNDNAKVTGNCLCECVAFEVTGPLGDGTICHCSQCRRQSGHAWASTQVDDTQLRLTTDQGLTWHRSSATAQRGFCRVCGSTLFWKHDKEAKISISAGALNPPTGLRLTGHIFAGDKGDYYDINEHLNLREG